MFPDFLKPPVSSTTELPAWAWWPELRASSVHGFCPEAPLTSWPIYFLSTQLRGFDFVGSPGCMVQSPGKLKVTNSCCFAEPLCVSSYSMYKPSLRGFQLTSRCLGLVPTMTSRVTRPFPMELSLLQPHVVLPRMRMYTQTHTDTHRFMVVLCFHALIKSLSSLHLR